MLSVYECDDCDRSFRSQQALDQYLNSPAHAPSYKCDESDRSVHKLPNSTLILQLTLLSSNATIVIGYLATSMLLTSTLGPQVTSLNATTAIDCIVASSLSSSTSTFHLIIRNAISPLEAGSLIGSEKGCT